MIRVVVIGGVAAGMSAASKLKRNLRDNVDIVVYEAGGEVSYGACGIPFYLSGIVGEPEDLIARTPEQFRESGIDVQLCHRVVSVDTDAKTVLVKNFQTSEEFVREYDKLIIGSGAKPKKAAPLDIEKSNLMVVRNLVDARRIRETLENNDVQNVVVIGAGYIGLEIVDACKSHGKQVTLVESAPHVLRSLDPELSELLRKELDDKGIKVKVNSQIKALECDGDKIISVLLDNGEEQQTDLVVNCSGIEPCTDFISGIDKIENGAIKVNENMQASLPDIYAAGDCSVMRSFVTGEWLYMPLGTNANKQGRIIADVIAGKPAPVFKLIGSTAIKLFDLDAAKVGLSEHDAKVLGLDYKTSMISANSFASYYGSEKVNIKLIYVPESKEILGAQLVGKGTVVPRANYFSIAIANKMPADEFGFSDLCYSPPFSGVWDASLIAANTCK